MTPEQLTQITEIIKQTIQEKVNGKLDRLDVKLDNYIKQDNEWKSEVMPTITQTKKIMDFASVGSVVLKTLVLIGTILAGLWGGFTFITNYLKK